MGFISICSALYDYKPQGENELDFREGELLYILEKGAEDGWWKAKKKAAGEEEDEPEGLIPNNYVEHAKPIHVAKALYDYARQTDEEVSFTEDTTIDVFDISDPDWTLVGVNGEFGFAPANYIEISSGAPKSPSAPSARRNTEMVGSSASPTTPNSPASSFQTPAAALANVLGGGAPRSPTTSRTLSSPRVLQQQLTPEASDEEPEENPPALPQRPRVQSVSASSNQNTSLRIAEPPGIQASPPYNRAVPQNEDEDTAMRSPGGFHLYNISEMVSAMGRRRKMPVVLGLNIAKGTIILSPEKSRDGPTQKWTAEKLTHYSIEGKHVFLELIRPSKSLDLHAGANDTAQEIVSALAEIAGAARGEGIREVFAAASGAGVQKKGQVLYDFAAQGDDEVTVAVGDEVIVLDDTKSPEWWIVRRVENGKEGVVPSMYIEITGATSIEPPSRSGINAGKSTVEQNRIEEERLTIEAARSNRNGSERISDKHKSRGSEVGPGIVLPQRGSSLTDDDPRHSSRHEKHTGQFEGKSRRSKPDPTKTRTWTDRSGSFKVQAQFIGLTNGKIHLHKQNGVKIAVPVNKMSPDDLEYVEKVTSEIEKKGRPTDAEPTGPRPGGSVEQPKVPEYDWFDFFLNAGVGPHQCERYAQSMIRDSMDESVLPDITPDILRTLGLKEGDVLKVMKFLDQKFGRTRSQSTVGDAVDGEESNTSSGGIFSGSGGALYNNTRRGRPEANRTTADVVDPKAFKPKEERAPTPLSEAKPTPRKDAPSREKSQNTFEDDAWEMKPSKQTTAPNQQPTAPSDTVSKPPPLNGAMADLSVLSPLQPTIATSQQTSARPPDSQITSASQPVVHSTPTASATVPPPIQPSGANPSFFSQINQMSGGTSVQAQPAPPQPLGSGLQQQAQFNQPRQRPQPPQQNFPGSSLLSPPPRPLSAPQNFPQQSQFGPPPLQPQLTGIPRAQPLQAPPGQSLNELNQQRLQQQFIQAQIPPQATGLLRQGQGFAVYANGLQTSFQPQLGGFQLQPQQQSYVNGTAMGGPFADNRASFQAPLPPSQIGIGSYQQQGQMPGSINAILPPPLQPQKTAFISPMQQLQPNGYQQALQPQPTSYPGLLQPQVTGFQQPQDMGVGQASQPNGFSNFQIPPVPPVPQQPTIAPLLPQKTGPAPPVRFGVSNAAKLTPQPTGRRANLSQATPGNPFGF